MVGLLAQVTTGDVANIGGVGSLVGSGLLAGVLFWLLYKYIPMKDEQLIAKDKDKDTLILGIIKSFRDEMAAAREACAKELQLVRDQDRTDKTEMAKALLQNTQETRALSAAVSNLFTQAGIIPQPPAYLRPPAPTP